MLQTPMELLRHPPSIENIERLISGLIIAMLPNDNVAREIKLKKKDHLSIYLFLAVRRVMHPYHHRRHQILHRRRHQGQFL